MRQARGSKEAPAPPKAFDPYKPLDPNDPGSTPLRPFRKVKPRRCGWEVTTQCFVCMRGDGEGGVESALDGWMTRNLSRLMSSCARRPLPPAASPCSMHAAAAVAGSHVRHSCCSSTARVTREPHCMLVGAQAEARAQGASLGRRPVCAARTGGPQRAELPRIRLCPARTRRGSACAHSTSHIHDTTVAHGTSGFASQLASQHTASCSCACSVVSWQGKGGALHWLPTPQTSVLIRAQISCSWVCNDRRSAQSVRSGAPPPGAHTKPRAAGAARGREPVLARRSRPARLRALRSRVASTRATRMMVCALLSLCSQKLLVKPVSSVGIIEAQSSSQLL